MVVAEAEQQCLTVYHTDSSTALESEPMKSAPPRLVQGLILNPCFVMTLFNVEAGEIADKNPSFLND